MTNLTSNIAASVLIEGAGGRILGVSRKDNSDDWGLPGGKAEPGEEPIQAAIRECFEETGVVVRASHLTEIFRGPARTPGRVMIVYRAEDWSKHGEPQPGEGKVDWIQWEDLERGSFGDFHKVFHRAFVRHEEGVRDLANLLFRMVTESRPRNEVEDDCADRFGLSIFDAIRLVSWALKDGVLVPDADSASVLCGCRPRVRVP